MKQIIDEINFTHGDSSLSDAQLFFYTLVRII